MCNIISVIPSLTILTQYEHVTHGWTDGLMDGQTDRQAHNNNIYCASVASHGNQFVKIFDELIFNDYAINCWNLQPYIIILEIIYISYVRSHAVFMSNNETYHHEELTFKMQWSDNVMSNQLKVCVSNPLLDVPFATREKVINNSDFMAH